MMATDEYLNLAEKEGLLSKLVKQGQDNTNQAGQELYGEQERILKNISGIGEARKLFGVSGTDETLSFTVKIGYEPRPNTLPRFKQFGPGTREYNGEINNNFPGNPYLIWDGGKVGGADLRFVLSTINMQDNEGSGPLEDVEEGGTKDGIIYVFRNEYNPALAVTLWSVNAADDNRDRVIFSDICQEANSDKDDIVVGKSEFGDINLGQDHSYDNTPIGYRSIDRARAFPDDPDDEDSFEIFGTYNIDQGNPNEYCKEDNSAFAKAIKAALGAIAEAIGGLLASVINWLQDVVNVGALSSNEGLLNAWKTIRDFVNSLFIIILIVVAFSNILRVDTERYGVRALLPRLIFAVIAVNFSFLLMQIMVNVATIVGTPFAEKARDLLGNPPADSSLANPDHGIGVFIVEILVLIFILVALFVLLFFLIVRILMIWLLAALSPFVFLAMVLPFSRSGARSWMSNATKWVFMGPVSFLILYIAAEIIVQDGKQDISNTSFILNVGFFAGAAIAAVLIPLKLGGEVMARAANAGRQGLRRGAGAAGLGARGAGAAAMFAADRNITKKLPGGGDTTLGTRMRATGLALGRKPKPAPPGSRQALKQQLAGEHLAAQTSAGQGVGLLTGATEGQRLTAFDAAVHSARQEMARLTPTDKRKIAYAHQQKTKVGQMVKDDQGNELGVLTQDEHDFSGSRVKSAAAFQELSESALTTPYMVEGPNNFADTGYTQRNAHDPIMSSYGRDGKINDRAVDAKASLVDPNDLKGIDDHVVERAHHAAMVKAGLKTGEVSEYDNKALRYLQGVDTNRLRYAVSEGHRNSFNTQDNKDRVAEIAAAGGFNDANKEQAIIQAHNEKL